MKRNVIVLAEAANDIERGIDLTTPGFQPLCFPKPR